MKKSNTLEDIKKYVGLFKDYKVLPSAYDEFFHQERQSDPQLQKIIRFFDQLPYEQFKSFHELAHGLFRQRGITFNVYSNQDGQEKIFPFDLIPRVVCNKEWQKVERGLEQRVQTLNAFLLDIYGDQKILKDGKLPKDIILSSSGYLPKLRGIIPPGGVYLNIAGIDLIRENDSLTVLEDNLKVPSGVSYVLENRRISKQLFPSIFSEVPVLGVDDYPLQLKKTLLASVSSNIVDPLLVLLTPGPFNSAYFEHVYLSHRMGCPLVQNCNLVVQDEIVYLKTLKGLKRVDVIYRRTDDEYIDPTFFNPKSLLGVPGIVNAYRKGNVILANALGNGVADDKAVYPFVPDMIRYYLNEEPILPQVETYSCTDPKARQHVLNNLSSCVIKIVNQSGGYGIVIGEQASSQELEKIRERIIANPRDYIAQPLKQLSSSPTLSEGSMCPRRIDLRPFVLTGRSTWTLPGGLTRVALVKDSFIVNSSQGGGSKDTWVLGGL